LKTCTRCKIEKSDDNFYLIKRPGNRKPTLYRHCKACCSEVSKENKDYSRNWELLKKYGITLEEYNKECEERENHCDICLSQVKTLHVDHCHSSGKVRGYLCGSCNRALGLFQDNTQTMKNAINYLQQKG
jgi:hypothetical protein